MAFPRITAAIFLFLMIGSLSLFCICVAALINPMYAEGVEQVDGKVVAVEANMDFVLETGDGQDLYFHCNSSCRGSLAHLRRHYYERAMTVVYYTERTDKSLMVLDVD